MTMMTTTTHYLPQHDVDVGYLALVLDTPRVDKCPRPHIRPPHPPLPRRRHRRGRTRRPGACSLDSSQNHRHHHHWCLCKREVGI